MADFQLQVFTQQSKTFDAPVTSVVVPAESGYLGVLAHHAPLAATLGEGTLTIRQGSQETHYGISGGFLEVHDNVATLLVDDFRPAGKA
jgi:F-type H+-transporting ATPase subunit epsilon